MEILARWISIAFHPLFCWLLYVLCVLQYEFGFLRLNHYGYLAIVLSPVLFSLVATQVIPAGGKVWEKAVVRKRRSRFSMYLWSTLALAVILLLSLHFQLIETREILEFWMLVFLSILACSAANLWVKVSLHGCGISLVTTHIFLLFTTNQIDTIGFLFAGVFLWGCIGWARLFLGDHSSKEYFLGTAIGVCTPLFWSSL